MNDLAAENIQLLAQSDLSHLTESFSPDRQAVGEKYIVFYLDEKLYAVSAGQVVEVIQMMPVTPLPKSPKWLSGIINSTRQNYFRHRFVQTLGKSNLRSDS